jgi:hypothetical protein
MTQTVLTYETAKNLSLEDLAKLGRYTLRSLGEEIPAWGNNDEKQAFLKLETGQQAAAVFKAIQERSKQEKGGGKPAAAASAKPAATRTPSNKSTAAAAKEPAAVASGDVGGATAQLLELLTSIKEAQERLEEKVDALSSACEANIPGMIAGNNKLVAVSVSLALQMSEQVLNAPASGVLQTAIEQLPEIEGQLAELVGDSGNGEGDDSGN